MFVHDYWTRCPSEVDEKTMCYPRLSIDRTAHLGRQRSLHRPLSRDRNAMHIHTSMAKRKTPRQATANLSHASLVEAVLRQKAIFCTSGTMMSRASEAN